MVFEQALLSDGLLPSPLLTCDLVLVWISAFGDRFWCDVGLDVVLGWILYWLGFCIGLDFVLDSWLRDRIGGFFGDSAWILTWDVGWNFTSAWRIGLGYWFGAFAWRFDIGFLLGCWLGEWFGFLLAWRITLGGIVLEIWSWVLACVLAFWSWLGYGLERTYKMKQPKRLLHHFWFTDEIHLIPSHL